MHMSIGSLEFAQLAQEVSLRAKLQALRLMHVDGLWIV
jgi:hypothetical protein